MKLTASAPNNFAVSDQTKAKELAKTFENQLDGLRPTDSALRALDSEIHEGLFPLVRFYLLYTEA